MKKLLAMLALLIIVALVVGCAPQVTETVESTSDDGEAMMEDTDSETMMEETSEDEQVDDVELDVYDEEDDLGDII